MRYTFYRFVEWFFEVLAKFLGRFSFSCFHLSRVGSVHMFYIRHPHMSCSDVSLVAEDSDLPF